MSPFLARRQYNTPILYIGVQRIACTDIEAAAKWPWKNDLSLRGNFGLHGKTILPSSRRFRNTSFQLQRRQADRIFNAFFTTNLMAWAWDFASAVPSLRSHGDGLWASNNRQPSARRKFYSTLPSKSEPPE
jgi:hypothetical protein